MTNQADSMRWVWRGIAGVTLVLGWLFILWQNKFNVTVPVVVIALGYLAVVATVSNLWRVGAAAVSSEDESPDAWTRPIGARGELEKEKKTLLKAIKEAEFDHAMGKLSKADADDLIRMYRARAIEVIKEIDRLDAGQAGTTREQIQREVQARLAVDSKSSKKDKRTAAAAAKAGTKADGKAKAGAAKAEAAKAEAEAAKDVDDAEAAKADDKAEAAKADDDAKAATADGKAEAATADNTATADEPPPVEQPTAKTTEATS